MIILCKKMEQKDQEIEMKIYVIRHGLTDCNIKKIYASHLKARVSDKQYFNIFPKDRDITLIKMGKSYNIL